MFFSKKILVFIIISISILIIFAYILLNTGNNIFKNKNEIEIVENLLNQYLNYEAQITIKIISNKTKNEYKMLQIIDEEKEYMKILAPEELKELEIIFDKNLIIKNNRLNMEKVYFDYKNLGSNNLYLNHFVKSYYLSKNKNFIENEDELIFEVYDGENTYIGYLKKLYVDKTSCLPKKMEIKNREQNTIISIIYNDIKIK